jgi:hypothetical protein
MKNKYLPWVVGTTLFAGIAGVWVWQLPTALERARDGKEDSGLQMIMSAFGQNRDSVGKSMQELNATLDANLKGVADAIEAEQQKAETIAELKARIEQDAKDKAAAAVVAEKIIDSSANTNTNVR